MIELLPNLYVGNQQDYEQKVKLEPGWLVVQACKFPYHRSALGHAGTAAPQDHPEYLVARRQNRLILNMIDVQEPSYFSREMIDAALSFIHEGLAAGNRVLVHCNQGESRSPSIGLLYLAVYTDRLPVSSFFEAEAAFRKLYPPYNPKAGIRGFMMANWPAYMSGRKA